MSFVSIEIWVEEAERRDADWDVHGGTAAGPHVTFFEMLAPS